MGSVYALVPAAGRSTRMGHAVNKQLLELAGRPLIENTLRALLAVPVDGIVLVVAPGEESNFAGQLDNMMQGVVKIVTGGATRRDSVRRGLLALPASVELVAVHDGARPLVNPALVREAVREARRWGAATLAVPVKDTIKVADAEGMVLETLPRDTLWQIQTPQVFRLQLLKEAHRVAVISGYTGTDDASLVERLGHPVKLVLGDYANIKITTPEDLLLAQSLIRGLGGDRCAGGKWV